ncbi:polysaccharide biosynthesis protein, partial [Escherichia coli]|nr:polysaccharide biosynthesis protein [Escherichia coli]
TSIYVVISFVTLSKDNLLTLFSVRFDYITDALKFGVPLVPHIIGIFFLSAIDRILINSELGVSEAGIYMLAVQLSLGMVVFFDAINKALIPWLFRVLSENDKRKIRRLVQYTYYYFVLLIFLGGLSFWIGPLIVELIAGNNYLRATSVIGWLCLGQAFNGMYLMVTNYIFYAKKTVHLSV